MATNYYTVLGLTPGANSTEIKEAYRRLCFKYHPDKTDGDCSEKMKALAEAYEILSNNKTRMIYIELLQAQAENAALSSALGKMIYIVKKLVWAIIIIAAVVLVGTGVVITNYIVGKAHDKPVAEQAVSPSAAVDKDVKAFFDKQIQK